jgi:hypothetical protein
MPTARVAPSVPTRTEAVPHGHGQLVELAAWLLVPCILIGTTLNQHPILGVKSFGQIAMWLAFLSAIEIAYRCTPYRWLFPLSLGALLVSRAARVVVGSGTEVTALYIAGMAGIFGLASAWVVARRPALVRRQVWILLAASGALMLVQMYGRPEILHTFRTDIHDPFTGRVIRDALFQRDPLVGYSTLQLRPAGLLFANNFLSLVLLGLMAVSFGRWRGGGLDKIDWALALVVAFTMSKMVFVTLILVTAILFFLSGRPNRRRMLKFWMALALFLALYYLLFPGVFLYNVSPTNALINVNVRFADLSAAIAGLDIAQVSVEGFDGSIRSYSVEAGSQSAISRLGSLLPVLAGLGLLIAPIYLIAIRRIWHVDQALARTSIIGAVAFLLAPLATSFLENPMYWVIFGLVLLPLHVGTPARR